MGGAYLPSTTAETLAVLAAFISSVNIAGESPKRRCLTVTPASYSNAEPNIYQLEPVIELVCVDCTITSFQLSPVPPSVQTRVNWTTHIQSFFSPK
ncbi:hypothetical protein ILYODFUR_035457 [Ilyodon furcidens]|uniref:Uncharacterized protein n=1 Tax=Ilyodon furcidens TaxID=33524 RepID=A0ABV0SRX0_9TELE